MPPSLPLCVGCVICKCTDSCSRSPSFDSAVDVINGSANCDSSQTRWEQLWQPISTLSLFFRYGPLSLKYTGAHWTIFTDTLAQPIPRDCTLKHLGSSVWCTFYLPCLVLGFPFSFHPVIFLLIFFLPSSLFSTATRHNFSALWPSLPPRAYLSF